MPLNKFPDSIISTNDKKWVLHQKGKVVHYLVVNKQDILFPLFLHILRFFPVFATGVCHFLLKKLNFVTFPDAVAQIINLGIGCF